MKKIFFIFCFVPLMLRGQVNITYGYGDGNITDDQKKIIEKYFYEYSKEYSTQINSKVFIKKEGPVFTFLRGRDDLLFTETDSSLNRLDEYSVHHKIFHLLRGETKKLEYLKMKNVIVYFDGLSVIVSDINQNVSVFTAVEEAVAEALAFNLIDNKAENHNIKISDNAYIILDLIKKSYGQFDFGDLLNFQKQSDFLGFASFYFSKPRNLIKEDDIVIILNYFN